MVVFVEKCSVLEGHKVTYGLIRNEIMLGNGTLPVAALTLSEPLEPQFVEAASRTRPLRSIAGELGLARTKINRSILTPHYEQDNSGGGVRHSHIYITETRWYEDDKYPSNST